MKSKLFGRALSLIVCAALIASMFTMSFVSSADIYEDGDTTIYEWDFTDLENGQTYADEMDEVSNKFDIKGGAYADLYGYNEELGAYEMDTSAGVGFQTRGYAIQNPYNTYAQSFTLVGGGLADYQSQMLRPGVIFAADENGYFGFMGSISSLGLFQKILYYYSYKDGSYTSVNTQVTSAIETMLISAVNDVPVELSDDRRNNIGYLNKDVTKSTMVTNCFTWVYQVDVDGDDINITVTAEYNDGEFEYSFTSDTYTYNLDTLLEVQNIGAAMQKAESHYRFGAQFGFFSIPTKARDSYADDENAPDQENQATQIYSVYAVYEDAGDNCTHPIEAVEIDGVAEPTCTKDGYTGDETCGECGEVVKEGSEIPALGHDWKETERVDATIEEPGYYKQVCKRCDTEETVDLEPLEALTVTFLGEGDEVIEEQIVGYGLAAVAPTAPESILGYQFIGWDTTFDNVTTDLTVRAVFFDPSQYEDEYTFDFNMQETSVTDAVVMDYLSKNNNITGKYDIDNGGYKLNPGNFSFAAIQSPLHKGLVSLTAETKGNPAGIIFAQDENGYYAYRITYSASAFRRSVVYYYRRSATSYLSQSLVLKQEAGSSFNPVLATIVAIDDQPLDTYTQNPCTKQTSIDYAGMGSGGRLDTEAFYNYSTNYSAYIEDGVIYIEPIVTYDDGMGTSHTFTLETEEFSIEKFTDESNDYANTSYINATSVTHDKFEYILGYCSATNGVSGYTNETVISYLYGAYEEYTEENCPHDERDWVYEGKTFDCETGGMSGTVICGFCGATVKESEELEPVKGGHSWILVSETTETKVYECSTCGAIKEEVACTHTETTTQNEKAATCTEDGYSGDVICSSCGETVTQGSKISALGHDEQTEVTKEATCTEAGSKTVTCSRCDYTATEAIEALGHDEQTEVTKAATCTEKGVKTVTCSRCDYTATEEIEMIDHNYVADAEQSVAPTCEEAGKNVSACSACGDKKEEDVPALGHDTTTTTTKEPTCTEKGVETTTCSRCDYTATVELEMLDHTPSDWKTDVEPTKDAEGSAHIECTVCGEVLETKVLEKLPAGTYGDVNGDGRINTGDAVIISKYSSKLGDLPAGSETYADVNGDGRINTGDAVLVARLAAKLITSFPVENKG